MVRLVGGPASVGIAEPRAGRAGAYTVLSVLEYAVRYSGAGERAGRAGAYTVRVLEYGTAERGSARAPAAGGAAARRPADDAVPIARLVD